MRLGAKVVQGESPQQDRRHPPAKQESCQESLHTLLRGRSPWIKITISIVNSKARGKTPNLFSPIEKGMPKSIGASRSPSVSSRNVGKPPKPNSRTSSPKREVKTDVAKEDCDPEKNAKGTQRFVMSDADDVVLDEEEVNSKKDRTEHTKSANYLHRHK